MKKTKTAEAAFHAVEFMREVRAEMTEQYLTDRSKYLSNLKQGMNDFKERQQKVLSQVPQ
jgi:hypothetical protein